MLLDYINKTLYTVAASNERKLNSNVHSSKPKQFSICLDLIVISDVNLYSAESDAVFKYIVIFRNFNIF